MLKPFALQLYEQFLAGKTHQELAVENDMPLEGIEVRLRAAAEFLRRPDNRPGIDQAA